MGRPLYISQGKEHMKIYPLVHHHLLPRVVVHQVLASAHQVQWREKSKNQKELRDDRSEKSKKKINQEQERFEVIPENSRNFWNLPKAIPAYVTAKFERRIKGSGIQESILSEIPFPENVEGPKVVNGHLKELFLESRKNKEMDRKKKYKKSQEKSVQKV